MKMKKKTLAMLLSASLVISSAAFGTIAYLTDRASVTNRFTVGNVSIDVDETVVTPDGEPVDADNNGQPDRTTEINGEEGNLYHLIPGHTYTKDPTLTVKKGSEESYVRMIVTITNIDKVKAALGEDFLPESYVDGWNAEIWPCVSVTTTDIIDPATQAVTGQNGVYEFRYYTTVDGFNDAGAAEDAVLESLFESFTIPGEATGEQLASLADVEIQVVGYAIQKEGFADEDAAWAAFPETVTTTSVTSDQQEDSAAGV